MQVRNQDMVVQYTEGATLQEIGSYYGITRERVRQIIARAGVTRYDGGIHSRAEAKREAKAIRKDRKSIDMYGLTHDEIRAIKDRHGNKPIKTFRQQQHSAAKRGIHWDLLFSEWWLIWRDSGKWEQRGRGKGEYCMGRHNDCGAYKAGNVKIITVEKNQSEYIRRYWGKVKAGILPPPKPRKEQQKRTHCRRGHPFSGENLYVNPTNGDRCCRACRAVACRRREAPS